MSSNIKISVIVTNKRGDILLLKEKTTPKRRALWNIIKGTYGDNGQETIFGAAKRECKEEASIDIKLVAASGCYITGKLNKYKVQFNFIGKIVKGEPRIAAPDEQKSRNEYITEVKWFSKKDVKKLTKNKFVSEKIFIIIQDWLKAKSSYPLSIFKQL